MDVNKDVKFCRFVCFVFFFWFFIGLSNLTFTTLLANSADNKLENFLIFPRKQDLILYANCLHWRQFAWNAKSWCLGKIRKKNIRCLLKILPRVLSLKISYKIGCAPSKDRLCVYAGCSDYHVGNAVPKLIYYWIYAYSNILKISPPKMKFFR